jgi:hypothetical protein
MTTGALIFAFNNEQTDYVAMAAWSAQNIRRHLNIPVAVVTDCVDHERNRAFDRVINVAPQTGGTRWFEDYAATVSWHNAGRVDAYALTPWDRTLVLDADYVVCSDRLKAIVDADQDFMCHRLAVNMSTGDELDGLNYFGRARMPMWWATVMMFRRSNTAQYIFDSMNMIRDNWQHYRDLYGIDRSTYRNDFALSIALGIVNGHTTHAANIPWPLMNVMPEDTLEQVGQDCFSITYLNSENKPQTVGWSGFDFHAMGKRHLENAIAAN